jgi:hypothetical protein
LNWTLALQLALLLDPQFLVLALIALVPDALAQHHDPSALAERNYNLTPKKVGNLLIPT